jgi:hypothetical protein
MTAISGFLPLEEKILVMKKKPPNELNSHWMAPCRDMVPRDCRRQRVCKRHHDDIGGAAVRNSRVSSESPPPSKKRLVPISPPLPVCQSHRNYYSKSNCAQRKSADIPCIQLSWLWPMKQLDRSPLHRTALAKLRQLGWTSSLRQFPRPVILADTISIVSFFICTRGMRAWEMFRTPWDITG